MGFFKDIKDVTKQGKALGDYHGGMPSWKQGMSDFRAVTDDGGETEVLKQGNPGNARVVGIPMPVPGNRFAMQVELEVQGETGAPYTVHYAFPTTRMKAALSPGMTVPVKIMPDDPQHIAIHWDAQQANIAAQGGDMNAAMAGLNSFYGDAANDAMKAAMAGQPAAGAAPAPAPAASTPEERLAKLEDLRSKGVLSETEYQQKRNEIISEI